LKERSGETTWAFLLAPDFVENGMRGKDYEARTVAVIALALCVVGAACGRDGASVQRRSRVIVVRDTQSTDSARVDTAESGGDVVGEWIDNPVNERWITDANVLSLFSAMNARQIAAADVELEDWHNDAARAFAASIAREHAELQHSADSLAVRLRIAPIAPALTKPWMSVMQAQIDTMRRARATSLDRAFVHQQVASHQLMLDYIEQLASASQHPDLRSMLTAAAKRVASQAERARSLETALAVRSPDR
jgi:predicted outer membrane protein